MASRFGVSRGAALVAAVAGNFGRAADPITAAVITPLVLRNDRRLLLDNLPA
jgi:hypothetical protein